MFALSHLLVFGGALPLNAEDRLESNSPFYPPGYDPNPKQTVAPSPVESKGPLARQLEFRGVAELNGVYQISIYNKAEQKSYWVKVGEKKEGIHVTAFDIDSMAVTLNQSGRSERISIMESTDRPMPVVVSAPPALPKNNISNGNLKPAFGNLNRNVNDGKKKTVPRRRVILPKR